MCSENNDNLHLEGEKGSNQVSEESSFEEFDAEFFYASLCLEADSGTRKKKKFPRFNMDRASEDPKFEVGQLFPTKGALIRASTNHGLKHGKQLSFLRMMI